MTSNTRWAAAFAVVAGMAFATSANATWTFGGTGTTSDVGGGTGATLSLTGAYAANGGTLTAPAGACLNATALAPCTTVTKHKIDDYAAGSTFGINGFASSGTAWNVNSSSNLQYYSGNGLGMASDSALGVAPNHAMDNGPATNTSTDLITGVGNTEAVLLSFSKSVVLSSIGIGYKWGDADISLFRYVGSSTVAPTLNGTGASLAAMNTAGWELVGNYADLNVDTTNPYNTVNAGGKGSSWWLISAYNSNYGAVTGSGTVNQGNDFFKVYAVAGTACTPVSSTLCGGGGGSVTSVPEPASLALASVSLMGLFGIRRRNNNKQA